MLTSFPSFSFFLHCHLYCICSVWFFYCVLRNIDGNVDCQKLVLVLNWSWIRLEIHLIRGPIRINTRAWPWAPLQSRSRNSNRKILSKLIISSKKSLQKRNFQQYADTRLHPLCRHKIHWYISREVLALPNLSQNYGMIVYTYKRLCANRITAIFIPVNYQNHHLTKVKRDTCPKYSLISTQIICYILCSDLVGQLLEFWISQSRRLL